MSTYTNRPAVIAYDVADDARRRQALRLLRPYRSGGQKSVHECWISSAQSADLCAALANVIDCATDRVLLSWVNAGRRFHARPQRGAAMPFALFPAEEQGPWLPHAGGRKAAPATDTGWHLIGYDIVCPKRLGKIARRLRKLGLHAQWSLFLCNASSSAVGEIVAELGSMLRSDDDLRAYPIGAPGEIWQLGRSRTDSLILPAPAASAAPSFWQRLRQGLSS